MTTTFGFTIDPTIQQIIPPPLIQIMDSCAQPIITIYPEGGGRSAGEVELSPGLEISDAAREFWRAVSAAYPMILGERIAALEAENKRLRGALNKEGSP